jgi:hypothetical protein
MTFKDSLESNIEYHLVFSRGDNPQPEGRSTVSDILRSIARGFDTQTARVKLIGLELWPREWLELPKTANLGQRDFIFGCCAEQFKVTLMRYQVDVRHADLLSFQTLESYAEEWKDRCPSYGFRAVTDARLEP